MRKPDLLGNRIDTFMGMRVISSPHIQPVRKIQVRDIKMLDGTSILTPEFRAKENAYYLERFGIMEVAYIFDTRALGLLGSGDKIVAMNPRHLTMLKNFV